MTDKRDERWAMICPRLAEPAALDQSRRTRSAATMTACHSFDLTCSAR
jgi:hypothetical protein